MIFTKKGQVLDIGAGGEWDDAQVYGSSVIYKDNVFYMFYSGNDIASYRIGLATSPDGVTFTKQGMVLDLGAGGEWDDAQVYYPSVIYKDNVFYLFYSGNDGGNNRIGLATSPDGVTFTKQGMVLDIGAGGAWDAVHTYYPSVIYKDNVFYLFYSGKNGGDTRIGLATSPDGVTFTKQGMVLDLGAGGEWDDAQVYGSSVIYKDNVFYMFYSGYDGGDTRIGLATSPDGVTFTKQGMVLDIGAGGAWDALHPHYPSVIYKDNVFYMFYSGHSGVCYRNGLAVSGCEPLRPHEFRVNAATGDMSTPANVNDGDTTTTSTANAINKYAEIDLGSEFCIKQYRQYGFNANNNDGVWKIQYWSGAAWVDWITGISTTGAAYTAWVEGKYIQTDKIRLVCTTVDSFGASGIKELEVKW